MWKAQVTWWKCGVSGQLTPNVGGISTRLFTWCTEKNWKTTWGRDQKKKHLFIYWIESFAFFRDVDTWYVLTPILRMESFVYLVKVNLFQKCLFLHQLIHNMTKDCSLIYHFSTWKLQAQNMLCTQIVFVLFWHSEQFMYTTCS